MEVLQRFTPISYEYNNGGLFVSGEDIIQSKNGVDFNWGSKFNTKTFFNGFHIDKWLTHTVVESARIIIQGLGVAKLSIIHEVSSGKCDILFSEVIELSNGVDYLLPNLKDLGQGVIYISFEGLSQGCVKRIDIATDEAAPNDIKLGLVITHFNRIKEVNNSVRRIEKEILSCNDFKDKIFLKVIDNSKNSCLTSHDNIEVINNLNLGGSGGFSRGLLELDNDGTFTHCLFMDDDASCEIESLVRTFQILRYSNKSELAVAGGLLRDDNPNIIWEKGAQFDGLCRPNHHGLDVSYAPNLFLSEHEIYENNYGAWWFFAFPIKKVEYYPIPFFVRGDDISFSLMNSFEIATFNGICSYGESFGDKSGVMPIYLDVRSHLVEQLCMLKHSKGKLQKTMLRFFIFSLFSYNYGTAKAVTLAIQDFCEGPDFFDNNKDMQSRFPVLKDFAKYETLKPDVNWDNLLVFKENRESYTRKLLRIITLNGFLLPNFMLSKKTVFQPKGFRAIFKEVFGFRKVKYVNIHNKTSYTVEMNRLEALRIAKRFVIQFFYFSTNFSKISKRYNNIESIASKRYWQGVYNKD